MGKLIAGRKLIYNINLCEIIWFKTLNDLAKKMFVKPTGSLFECNKSPME